MHHNGPIAGIAATRGLVATAGYDNQVILWDAQTRQPLARGCHDHLVNHCAFSADGRWLVSAGSDASARIWSLPDMRLTAVLADHGDDVDMALFSPDDQRIATCALDRAVRIFDRQGRCLQTMPGHTGNVLSLAWHADGRRLVSSGVDGTLRTWDTETGQALSVTDLDVRTDSVEIGADGSVYAGDDRGRIAIVRDGHLSFVPAHRAGIKKLVLDMSTRSLATLSYDRSMSIWHLDEEGQPVHHATTMLPAATWARAATVLPDGRVAVGTFGGSYAVLDPQDNTWDLQGVRPSGALNAVLHRNGRTWAVGDSGRMQADGLPGAAVGSLCNFLVAAGDTLCAGGQMGQLFDASSGEVLHTHHAPLNTGCAITLDGRPALAIGTYTGELLVLAAERSGQFRLLHTVPVFENAVKGVCTDGDTLFSVCANGDATWHRLPDMALVRHVRRGHERIANACCAIGPGRFASVSRDRRLRLWADDGVTAYDSPHHHSVKCMAVDAAQTQVLTGSYGGTLALFDLRTRHWTKTARPTAWGIAAITWRDSDDCFVAASYDGQLHRFLP